MSKGLGRIQRGCLDYIAANGVNTTMALTQVICPETEMITAPQLVAIRRALLSLERKGLLHSMPRTHYDGCRRWGTPDQVAADPAYHWGRAEIQKRNRRVLAGLPIRTPALATNTAS